MSRIVLGNGIKAGKDVYLDLDVLLRTRLLVQASSGKGKSWLLRRLCEQIFGKAQIIVLDPEGEYATLREEYDFVLVGQGGETPADPRTAELLAHRLLELRASTVCDLYDLKPTVRHEFVAAFLDALIEAPKKLRHSVVVIVDEAHLFCPEKGAGESLASESMISLATRGRKRGLAAIFATQRLSKLRKDAEAELHNYLIGGTFLDVDRKRAADALGVYGKDVHPFFDEIKMLERGRFYGLGPAIAPERILIAIGKVKTTHPDSGTFKEATTPPPPPAKIKALLPQLADLPKEAGERLKTEAELRARIRELERDARTAKKTEPKLQPIAAKPAAVQRKISDADIARAFMPIVAAVNQHGAVVHDAIRRAVLAATNVKTPDLKIDRALYSKAAAVLNNSAGSGAPAAKGEVREGLARSPQIQVPAYLPAPRPVADSKILQDHDQADGNGNKMVAGARRVLEILKQFHPALQSKAKIIVLAGVTARSLKDYLSVLRRREFIYQKGDAIGITGAGAEAAGDVAETPQSTEELVKYWKPKIGAGAGRVLDVLVESYPEGFDRGSLIERANVTQRSMKDYLSLLRRARLIDESAGEIKASETLFVQ